MLLFAQIEQWMLFAGVALMLVIMLRRYWRYYGRLKRQNKKQTDLYPSSKRVREGVVNSPLADAPPEALRWQVEMHETARELKAELDSKIGVLQALVRIADERIATLTAERERQQTVASETTEPTSRPAGTPLQDPPCSVTVKSASTGAPGSDSLRRSIYDLASRGWDATSIAAEIERPVGDVEMILSLRSAD